MISGHHQRGDDRPGVDGRHLEICWRQGMRWMEKVTKDESQCLMRAQGVGFWRRRGT